MMVRASSERKLCSVAQAGAGFRAILCFSLFRANITGASHARMCKVSLIPRTMLCTYMYAYVNVYTPHPHYI